MAKTPAGNFPNSSQPPSKNTPKATPKPTSPTGGPSALSAISGDNRPIVLAGEETIQVPMIQQGVMGTGSGLPSTNGNGTHDTTVRASSNLAVEYIVSAMPQLIPQFGGPAGLSGDAGIHMLPPWIDELEVALGTDIYKKMLFDAQMKASDATLRAGILDRPLQITPACSEDDDDVSAETLALAKAVADFVRVNLEKLPGGFHKASWAALEGIPFGYKLLEQDYEIRTIIPENGPQTCLASLNPKPHQAASIVTDKYNHILGYVPRLEGSGLLGNMLFGDLGVASIEGREVEGVTLDLPEMVRPEKVAHFIWMGFDDSPVGTSHLRAAYTPWRLKVGLYQAYEAYLSRFAQPSVGWELDGADLPAFMVGADGQVLKKPQDIAAAMLANLRNYQAGGAMLVPVGKLNIMEAAAGSQVFMQAFEMCDEQIAISILFANLATQGGQYGTQALGSVHQDTQGLLIAYGKQTFAAFVLEEIITPLVLYNYGDAGLAVLPEVSFGEVEQQDWATIAGGFASLAASQLLFPQQYNDMFKKLHLPALEADVVALLVENWKAGQAQATAMAQQGAQPGQPGQDPNNPQGGDPNAQGGQGQDQGSGQPGQDNSQGNGQAQGKSGGSGKQPDTGYWKP